MTRQSKIYIVVNRGTVYVESETPRQSQEREVGEVIREVDKLGKLIDKTNSIIYEISSFFPFQLFPDRVIIDENKVTIVRKELFFKRVYSIMFEDILTVRVNRGIIFAAIEFKVKRFGQNIRPITYLLPKEATLAKKYILGLIEAKNAKIDMSKLNVFQIKDKLEEIGQTGEEAENLF